MAWDSWRALTARDGAQLDESVRLSCINEIFAAVDEDAKIGQAAAHDHWSPKEVANFFHPENEILAVSVDSKRASTGSELSRRISPKSARVNTATFESTKDALVAMVAEPASTVLQQIKPTFTGLTEIDVLVRGQHLISMVPNHALRPEQATNKGGAQRKPHPRAQKYNHEPRKVITFSQALVVKGTAAVSVDTMEELYDKQPAVSRTKAEMERLKSEVKMEDFREKKVLDRIKFLKKSLVEERLFLKKRDLKLEQEKKRRGECKKRYLELETIQIDKKNEQMEQQKLGEVEKTKKTEQEQKRREMERVAIKAQIAEWRDQGYPRIATPPQPLVARPKRPPTVRERLVKERVDELANCLAQRPPVTLHQSREKTPRTPGRVIPQVVDDLSNKYGLTETERRQMGIARS
eukprot:GEMP01053954.1.p1 GENE.GEMP01053954.1~~GEMP01053954.1.p1  ORF type:complete len:408 (+),score=109.70 GEMP01053954.1:42-1265(+)